MYCSRSSSSMYDSFCSIFYCRKFFRSFHILLCLDRSSLESLFALFEGCWCPIWKIPGYVDAPCLITKPLVYPEWSFINQYHPQYFVIKAAFFCAVTSSGLHVFLLLNSTPSSISRQKGTFLKFKRECSNIPISIVVLIFG